MQDSELAGEEGSEGQGRAPEEVIEPDAEIDRSDLGRDAGE